MAALYGRLQGSRGEATRCGTKTSGMDAQVETWSGIIHVRLDADGDYWITTSDKHGNRRRVVLEGNVDRDEITNGVAAEIKTRVSWWLTT